jgi:hypothetical protein
MRLLPQGGLQFRGLCQTLPPLTTATFPLYLIACFLSSKASVRGYPKGNDENGKDNDPQAAPE